MEQNISLINKNRFYIIIKLNKNKKINKKILNL